MFFNRNHTQTSFVQLDTQKCKACWKCIENCPNMIIKKVDLRWHKHSLIVQPDACTGCLNCVNICQYNAYSIIDRVKQKTEKKRKRTFYNFLVNNLLLVSGLIMIFSGLILQIGYHMDRTNGHHIDVNEIHSGKIQHEQLMEIDKSKIVCGFNYTVWSTIHKFIIVFFSLLMIYHTYVHWKWYKGVFNKHLISKNKQVVILSILFILVVVSGIIPWFIDLSGSTSIIRIFFIEIHDKLALILIVFFILHFVKRVKWFATAYKELKK